MNEIAAVAAGFALDVRRWRGQDVWAWRHGDDARWPMFLSERVAWSWMDDRLRRTAIFS